MYPSIQIPNAEYEARIRRLVEYLNAEDLSGAILFDPVYVAYFADFAFIPTERPMALVVDAQGTRSLFVPRLELEHAQAEAAVDRVDHYPEYPDDPHPMVILKGVLEEMGIVSRVGADTDGYPWILGYQGPTLSVLTGAEVVRIGSFLEAQMAIKSPAELALIRESAKWGNLAHRLLQKYTRVGVT